MPRYSRRRLPARKQPKSTRNRILILATIVLGAVTLLGQYRAQEELIILGFQQDGGLDGGTVFPVAAAERDGYEERPAALVNARKKVGKYRQPPSEETSDNYQPRKAIVQENDSSKMQPPPTQPPGAIKIGALPKSTVHFLNAAQFNFKDPFSATWLQRTEEFLTMTHNVETCESAAFEAYPPGPKRDKLLMPLDLLDFSVEHLSKWWKMLDYRRNHVVYRTIMTKLTQYLRIPTLDLYYPYTATESTPPPTFEHALGMIAFLNFGQDPRARNLTVVSLAATLESMRRAELGRVVVVSPNANDRAVVDQTFQYLNGMHVFSGKSSREQSSQQSTQQVGHMEVGFYAATPEQYTALVTPNVPRACLMGAKQAFDIAASKAGTNLTSNETQYLQDWFGVKHPASYWKYMLLTEPDSILQTRPRSLPQLKAALDSDRILAPYRLQPIPHHSDLPEIDVVTESNALAPFHLRKEDNFNEVIELDALAGRHGGGGGDDSSSSHHDVCCDEAKGPEHRPGWKFSKCPNNERWWACGFQENHQLEDTDPEDRHYRLRPYQFFRLAQGIGLTTVAGNLFGRRCIPGKQTICTPP